MIHLVYVSSATSEMSEQDLVMLLEQSRSRNRKLNVTGMLLYANGNFFQVLEGQREDVEEIYRSILRDERNTGNIELINEEITEQTFPQWSMGFAYLTNEKIAAMDGYSEFLRKNIEPDQFANKPDIVLDLLYQFKEGMT